MSFCLHSSADHGSFRVLMGCRFGSIRGARGPRGTATSRLSAECPGGPPRVLAYPSVFSPFFGGSFRTVRVFCYRSPCRPCHMPGAPSSRVLRGSSLYHLSGRAVIDRRSRQLPRAACRAHPALTWPSLLWRRIGPLREHNNRGAAGASVASSRCEWACYSTSALPSPDAFPRRIEGRGPAFDVAQGPSRGYSHIRGRFEVHSSPCRGGAGVVCVADGKRRRIFCVFRVRGSPWAKNCVADRRPASCSLELSEFRQSCSGVLASREQLPCDVWRRMVAAHGGILERRRASVRSCPPRKVSTVLRGGRVCRALKAPCVHPVFVILWGTVRFPSGELAWAPAWRTPRRSVPRRCPLRPVPPARSAGIVIFHVRAYYDKKGFSSL